MVKWGRGYVNFDIPEGVLFAAGVAAIASFIMGMGILVGSIVAHDQPNLARWMALGAVTVGVVVFAICVWINENGEKYTKDDPE